MSKYIELVKKWLADPESVSKEELEANRKSAAAAYNAAREAAKRAAWSAGTADWAAYEAAYFSAAGAAYMAAYWVERYEELTDDPNITS